MKNRLFLTLIAGGIAFGAAGQSRAEVTYTKDIVPIFQKHCQECHRPGEAVPVTLSNYEETRPWVKSIRKVVSERTMPPWHADPTIGQWKNDRRLSQEEIDKVSMWADTGAPMGDPKDAPPPLQFTSGWKIGEPDVSFEFAEDEQLPAELEDEYRYVVIKTDLKEDRWIKAVECRPGNVEVVHHIIAFAKPRGMGARDENAQRHGEGGPIQKPTKGKGRGRGGPGGVVALGGMAPGTAPMVLPVGEAIKLPAGSDIVLQMHYHKEKGKVTTDRSRIGLKFADYVVTKQKYSDAVANFMFNIPPNNNNYEVSAMLMLEDDVDLKSVMPHMHLRGKNMKVWAKYPDGHEEDLIWVPNYDFNWQTIYEFSEPKRMPKGTKLFAKAHFDNSTENPANPDPNATVRFGEPTTAEMMFAFLSYTLPEEQLHAVDPGNSKMSAGGQ